MWQRLRTGSLCTKQGRTLFVVLSGMVSVLCACWLSISETATLACSNHHVRTQLGVIIQLLLSPPLCLLLSGVAVMKKTMRQTMRDCLMKRVGRDTQWGFYCDTGWLDWYVYDLRDLINVCICSVHCLNTEPQQLGENLYISINGIRNYSHLLMIPVKFSKFILSWQSFIIVCYIYFWNACHIYYIPMASTTTRTAHRAQDWPSPSPL